MRGYVGVVVVVALSGCRASPDAEKVFSDPIVGTFDLFEADDVDLAPMMRDLETQIYVNMQVDSGDVVKRSVTPGPLAASDVENLKDHPDRDPSVALPIATAWASPFDISEHATLPVLDDQTVLEPTSPDHYNRQFLEGKDCWVANDCTWLKTFQDLTKVYTGNIVPPIPYEFYKDFRWVDLNLGLDGATGSRWAYVARSYDPGSYSDEKSGKNTIWASYTIELWFPRDGGGFTWDNAPDGATPLGDDAGDSTAGGTLRFLSLWTDTELTLTDDPNMMAGTIRWGMDQNYKAHDDYLEAHAAP